MDFTFNDPRVRRTSALVQALARDLRRLEQNIPPSIEQMIEAPVLDDWLLTYRFEPALVGTVTGHPVVANGPAMTSGLFYLDQEARFARTLSRFYRLGDRRDS